MNRNGESVCPCSNPSVISKKGVSLSGDITMELIFLYSINMAFTISVGMPYMIKNSRFIESKDFVKSINERVAGRFLDFTHSSKRRIVKICPGVILFMRKPF